jgi:hypothetical protein
MKVLNFGFLNSGPIANLNVQIFRLLVNSWNIYQCWVGIKKQVRISQGLRPILIMKINGDTWDKIHPVDLSFQARF